MQPVLSMLSVVRVWTTRPPHSTLTVSRWSMGLVRRCFVQDPIWMLQLLPAVRGGAVGWLSLVMQLRRRVKGLPRT